MKDAIRRRKQESDYLRRLTHRNSCIGRMTLSFKTYGVLLILLLLFLGLYEEIFNIESPRYEFWKTRVVSIPDIDMELIPFALNNFR